MVATQANGSKLDMCQSLHLQVASTALVFRLTDFPFFHVLPNGREGHVVLPAPPFVHATDCSASLIARPQRTLPQTQSAGVHPRRPRTSPGARPRYRE